MLLNLAEQIRLTAPASPRCTTCIYREDCRGLDDRSLLFNCFDMLCCGTGKCDEVCPGHRLYYRRLAEVGGIRFDDLKPVPQKNVRPPVYVPHIQHQYIRHEILHTRWASISPYLLLREGGLAVNDDRGVRAMFRLGAETQIILRGTDGDKELERYWATRKRDGLPQRFAALGPAIFLAPNFSHFGDVPRTDNLWNRRRQLLCIEEMVDAGVNVAPHLNDITAGDWELWFSYMKENPSIHLVAKEFQTRCRQREEGLTAITRLAELQHRLGRELHPIIIGGAQFTERLSQEFRRFTILDSRPVLGAFNRHRFVLTGNRCRLHPERYLPGFGVDDLSNENVEAYAKWIARRARRAALSTNARIAG